MNQGTNTCTDCGNTGFTDEQMTIDDHGNPICIECEERRSAKDDK